MKKSKLDAVLRRKIRIKITRRKRGRFRVILAPGFGGAVAYFPTKREALVWLYTKLRCVEEKVLRIDCIDLSQPDELTTEQFLKLATGKDI